MKARRRGPFLRHRPGARPDHARSRPGDIWGLSGRAGDRNWHHGRMTEATSDGGFAASSISGLGSGRRAGAGASQA